MPNQTQNNKPSKINLDKSRKYLSADEASYLLNHDVMNPSALGKSVPLPANSPICEVEQPEGENFTVGSYYSPLTNETYSWVYNSNNNHYLQRINPDGSCQIVYSGDCMPLSAAPEHGIFNWRAIMRVEKICHNRHGKELIWVDGTDNDIFCLDVEASIATDSFTTPFFDRCPDECAPLKLCVPDHCDCIKGEFVPLPENEASLTNHLTDVGVKIIVKEVYYDLRESEWSIPSTLFYQDVKGGCFGGEQGFSRCLKLTIPIGNPLVDKIKIGYSTDNGATWMLSDTIEKYASYSSSAQYWYERDINPELDLTEDGCSFYYFFCNDKQCQAIDPAEVARVYNPIPRAPQGLFELKDAYAFYNYKQGNCPLDRIETDKFEVLPNCDNAADCITEMATVKVRAIVHSFLQNTNEPIWREKGTYNRSLSVDDVTDAAYFGGFRRKVGMPYYKTFDQTFAGKKRNFHVYVEGTGYSTEMVQWRAYQNFTKNRQVGVIGNFEFAGAREDVFAIITTGFYYYQEATIKVPKGQKGFIRIDSHNSPSVDHNTSTYVAGTIPDIHNYVSFDVPPPSLSKNFEIYFDTCNGDVDLMETFIISDNAEQDDSRAAHGTVIDNSGAPIAGVDLYASDDYYLGRTDHNGFYHFTLTSSTTPFPVKVMMESSCDAFTAVQTDSIDLAAGTNVVRDIRVLDNQFATGWYAYANVHVVDCNGNNIAGIPVAVSGAKFRYTDDSGTALIPIRNYPDRARQVRAIAMDASGCFPLDCNGNCNPCFSSQVLTAPACFDVVHFFAKTIDFADIVLNVTQKSLNNRGLKKGGRYGFGVVAKGDCGRISAVYPLKNEYVDIPKFQENSSEDFCSFIYKANKINLPEWVKCLQIARTENLNPFILQWVVDKIERTGDGKIILTIQSLNDYKEKYNSQVNTVYQYAQGDRVEFISNGDGKTFSATDGGILNYLILNPLNSTEKTDADFFDQIVIQDDGNLNELSVGAKIELQRAKGCTDEPAYFSICQSLEVVDGQVVAQTGNFETFDTYKVTRLIGNFSPQSFEHFAPSDFWLNKMDDRGKSYFVNKYENERRFGRNISLSSPTQINYFGDTVKTIDSSIQGDIIAMSISDAQVVMGICENDNFILQVASDLLRVSPNGEIVGIPADRIVGDPQPKLGGQFGCRYEDAGSIFFADSYTLWCDVRRDAFVKHGYGMNRDASKGPASDISENKMKTYFKTKFRQLQVTNASATNDLDKVRFVTGINKFNDTIALTIKSLHNGNINNEKAALLKQNETVIFNPYTDDFLTFVSYTPEAYSFINLSDEEGCAFIAYDKGVPFLHPVMATKWNEFFGTAVDRVMTIAINKFPEKIKIGLSMEIQDETMWFVDKVETDKPTYLSEIPPVKFKKTENKWNASFLGDKNSRGGLFGRDLPRGYFASVTFIRDNTLNLQYKTVNSAKQTAYDELDEIIFKVQISEQSGFTENV